MDLIESNQLRNESEHWWIKTRFYHLLRGLRCIEGNRKHVLEVGCGTCQNLAFLRKSNMSKDIERIVGFDPLFSEIPQFSWQQNHDTFVKNLDEEQHKSFDFLVAMDVLEHLENDEQHLRDWLRFVRNKGVVFITVPAFPFLWSYHDELLHHYRRYTKHSLLTLTSKVGLQPLKVSYAFSYVFPLVFLIRKVFASSQKQSTDLQESNFVVNKILYSLGKVEALLGGNPFLGTSVVGIFTYENSDSHSLL